MCPVLCLNYICEYEKYFIFSLFKVVIFFLVGNFEYLNKSHLFENMADSYVISPTSATNSCHGLGSLVW